MEQRVDHGKEEREGEDTEINKTEKVQYPGTFYFQSVTHFQPVIEIICTVKSASSLEYYIAFYLERKSFKRNLSETRNVLWDPITMSLYVCRDRNIIKQFSHSTVT
jgi:hypothetical protein